MCVCSGVLTFFNCQLTEKWRQYKAVMQLDKRQLPFEPMRTRGGGVEKSSGSNKGATGGSAYVSLPPRGLDQTLAKNLEGAIRLLHHQPGSIPAAEADQRLK